MSELFPVFTITNKAAKNNLVLLFGPVCIFLWDRLVAMKLLYVSGTFKIVMVLAKLFLPMHNRL